MDARQTLADFTFVSKYARYLPEKQRRESFPEAVKRMMDMHRTRYAGKDMDEAIDLCERAVLDRRILGSQRALQFGGEAILKKNVRINNCSASFADRPRFFAEALWLLLCGCGVGFSVQKHHVAKLPPIRKSRPEYSNPTHATYVVRDSIEGWADALDVLMDTYFNGGLPAVRFDYSQVRPEGAYLASASGKAPGPKPLRDALEAIRALLNGRPAGERLRPIDVYDIVMLASGAVLAGGVRRSATIAIFSPDDESMLSAKTGDWFRTHPWRSRSNNSALLVRGKTDRATFDRLMTATKEFGEPGFYWADSTEVVPNPCAEISFEPTCDGESGWGFCNLTSVNLAACATKADFYSACEAASILGTLQAGYQDVGYLTSATKRILERDAQIGVSLTGMADRPGLAFDPEVLQHGAAVVVAYNRFWAERIGIAAAVRCTTVKPEGTGSLVLKAGNGIHPHHARRYIRHVQMGAREATARFFAEHIPEAVEPSKWREGDVVVAFPIDLGSEHRWYKSDTNASEHLDLVMLVQQSWVQPGRTRGHLHNNVSNTIQVDGGFWESITHRIFANQDLIAGVSLLGATGDLDYVQAPFVAVDGPGREAVLAKFERLRAAWKELDFTEMTEASDETTLLENAACAGGACQI